MNVAANGYGVVSISGASALISREAAVRGGCVVDGNSAMAAL